MIQLSATRCSCITILWVSLVSFVAMIGVLEFDSRRRLGIFLFTTASRTALGPTQPPIQWAPGALFLGVKRPGREAGHSPPSSAEVRECVELYLHSPNTPSWRGAQLKKHRDNFTFSSLHCFSSSVCSTQGKALLPQDLAYLTRRQLLGADTLRVNGEVLTVGWNGTSPLSRLEE
jgi:hypothetical protein